MWFAYRKYYEFRQNRESAYRIGYAVSADGVNWNRRDSDAGIEPSQSGWDSEMIAYPYVISHERRLYMFYNGNGFGRTGFGMLSPTCPEKVSRPGVFRHAAPTGPAPSDGVAR